MTKTLALAPMEKANLIQDAEFAATAIKELLTLLIETTTELKKEHEDPMSAAKARCDELNKTVTKIVSSHNAKNPEFMLAIESVTRVINHTVSIMDLTKRRGLRVGKPYLLSYKKELADKLVQLVDFHQFSKGLPVKGTKDALSDTVVALAADADSIDAKVKASSDNSKNPVFMMEMNIVPPFNYFYVQPRKFLLHKLAFDRIGKGDNSDFIVLKKQKVLVVDNVAAENYKMEPLELAATLIEAINLKRPAGTSELAMVMEEHASLKGSSGYTFYWVVPLPTLHVLQPIIGQGTLAWGLAV
ncbi:hypothetical protein Voja6_00211 [Pseudomonas phage vB_PpuM-Voja-6]